LLLGGFGALAATALLGCSVGTPPRPAELVLATGPPGAVYREIGAALAEALAAHLPDTRVLARESSASVDNLRLLTTGQAHLGLTTVDAVTEEDAYADAVAAVGRLYDSFLHLVVLESSPVQSLADLVGRRVSIGASGSGTEFTVRRLLQLTRVRFQEVLLHQAESAAALAAGELDAFFTLTGIPTPAITALAARHPVRLVPLPAEAELLADHHPGPYIPATIPVTTYQAVPPCPTVAVPNLLVARDDLAADVVEVVTRTVFTESRRISAGHPEARRINVRTGIATGPVRLHPGAVAWFRSAKH